jgi:hypothetical protein
MLRFVDSGPIIHPKFLRYGELILSHPVILPQQIPDLFIGLMPFALEMYFSDAAASFFIFA